MAARKKAAPKKKAAKKKAAKRPARKRAKKAAAKKAAPKKRAARREHEGVPPASDRELEQLRGAPQDLPPGRQAEPRTLELTAEQTPDLAVAFAHYRHSFPKATEGDLVAYLLREYRRAEELLP